MSNIRVVLFVKRCMLSERIISEPYLDRWYRPGVWALSIKLDSTDNVPGIPVVNDVLCVKLNFRDTRPEYVEMLRGKSATIHNDDRSWCTPG